MDVVEQVRAAVAAACAAPLPEALGDFALEMERSAQRLRALASVALGALAGDDPVRTQRWWRDELGISGEAAGHAVRRARGLQSLPVLADAAVAGDLSLEQAGAFVPLLGAVDDSELTAMQESLVEGGRRRTVDSIQQWVRLLVAQHAEPLHELSHAEALAQQYLKHRTTPDGMVRGTFAFAAQEAEVFLTVLEPLARPTSDDDERTVGRRRADACLDVFAGACRWMELPQAGGQRAQVSYVVTAEWAAGQRGALPAWGAWTGPQTRAKVEAELCDARLSRLLLDPRGQVERLESLTGQITRPQRRAVSARDRCCVARGCTRPPAFCDVHHLVSRADGGPTTVENLVLLCRRHHVMWHEGRVLLPDLEVPWLRRPLDPPMVA